MTPDQLSQIADVATSLGVIGLLIAALVGGMRKWWVFGWVHRDLEEDRDYWRETALKGLAVGEKATTVAEARTKPRNPGA